MLHALGSLALLFVATIATDLLTSAACQAGPLSDGAAFSGSAATSSGLRLSATPRFFAGGVGYGASGEETEADTTLAQPTPPPEPAPEAMAPPAEAGPGRTKQMLLSALVPGLGQLSAGEKTWGSVFLRY